MSRTNIRFQIHQQLFFFRNGSEIGRIDDFESNPMTAADTIKPGVESNDKKRLKDKIIELYEKKCP
jgi:hypothetical protein